MPMNNDRLELAQWAVKKATAAGASDARVTVERTRYVSIDYREKRVEKLEESVENGLRIAIYADGKFSGHRTSDLRKDALGRFIEQGVAMTKYLEEDPHRRLPDPRYYDGRSDKDLGLSDARYDEVAPEDRHHMVQKVEAAALDAGGDKIISVEAGYYDATTNSTLVASNGLIGESARTDFWTGASVTAKDEGDKRPSDWWWEGHCYRGGIADPETIGRSAVDRALARVGAEKIPTEKLPMIIENRTGGRLLRFMSNGMYGRALQQKTSYLEGKVGEQIASPLLSVYDDPLIHQGQGSRHYDGEGMAAKRMPMMEKGVLRNYYIDTYYGRKLGVEPTTGDPSNVVFEYGDKSQEEWMKEIGRGLLVTGFIGGNSNSSTGDFSTGVYGFLFENGEIVKPVNELNIAGNHLEFWHQLIGMGNDPYPYSSMRTPTLVFDAVTVAGA